MADILRLAALAGVPHGFSDRDGFEAASLVPGAPFVRLRQVHSAEVVTVGEEAPDPAVAGDALVTATRGRVLAIVTADCAPVLLADTAAGVVGAAHAGWRGAHGGVIANTVAAMTALGARPERIVAAIGPTIAAASYEVDTPMRAAFGAGADGFFAPGRRPDRWQFDLPAYVASRLTLAGVRRVTDCGRDTYAEPDRFHSFRRAVHRGEPTGGRQISAIALP